MEWSRIKNVIIIALIFTNCLIIGMMIFSGRAPIPTENNSAITDEVLTVLNNNGISVSADIPQSEDSMPVLFITYDKHNGIFSYDPPSGSTPVHGDFTEDAAISIADDFLKVNGFDNPEENDNKKIEYVEAAQLSDYSGKAYNVVYGNYYKNLKIEGAYTICTVCANGVHKINRNWVYIDSESESEREIIPASTALLKFMVYINETAPASLIDVTGIELLYKVETPYTEKVTSDTAFPTWKITDSNNNPTYISAYK